MVWLLSPPSPNACDCRPCKNIPVKIPGLLYSQCKYSPKPPTEMTTTRSKRKRSRTLPAPEKHKPTEDGLRQYPFLALKPRGKCSPSISMSPKQAEGSNRKYRSHSCTHDGSAARGDLVLCTAETLFQWGSTAFLDNYADFVADPEAGPDILLWRPVKKARKSCNRLPPQNDAFLSPLSTLKKSDGGGDV